MGQYIPEDYAGKVILHQHNAEYIMWKRFSENEKYILKKIVTHFEASRVQKYERLICNNADAILAAPNDIDALCSIGIDRGKFHETYHLGDEEMLYSPDIQYSETRRSLLYIGTLTWEANIDGLLWFLENVWPIVSQCDSEVTFDIIGRNPDARILAATAQTERVRLLGFVEDLEPYYNQSRVFLSPLRFGSGIKVKVVNSLYRGLPTVTTSIGAEGLEVETGKHIIIADDPSKMANDLIKLLDDEILWNALRDHSRALMREKYTWDRVFYILDEVLECL
ncbi:glycosyltransferase [bacterium]|nr:glycosyltransferase [bacterium]